MRIEPAPSVPMCRWPRLSSAAAAAPPDEPPVVRSSFHGLRVMPVSGEWHAPIQPNSGSVVLPRMTAPASRSRATAGASSFIGASVLVSEPRREGMALHPDIVFHRRAQAIGEADWLAFLPARLGGLRRRERAVAIHDDEAVDRRLELLDAVKLVARHLDGREFALAVKAQQFGGGQRFDVGHGTCFVMPGLVPGIHDSWPFQDQRRGWPGQARP